MVQEPSSGSRPEQDKISGPMSAGFQSSTGLGFGTLIERARNSSQYRHWKKFGLPHKHKLFGPVSHRATPGLCQGRACATDKPSSSLRQTQVSPFFYAVEVAGTNSGLKGGRQISVFRVYVHLRSLSIENVLSASLRGGREGSPRRFPLKI